MSIEMLCCINQKKKDQCISVFLHIFSLLCRLTVNSITQYVLISKLERSTL